MEGCTGRGGLTRARVAALIGFALAIAALHLGRGATVRRDEYHVPGWSAPGGQGDDLRVWRYQASPPPAAPAVVLLHGYFASARMFERLYADELARRGIVVFAPEDLSAAAFATRGADDQSRLAIETAPLVALLQRVRRDPGVDADRIGLLGHSFGASLALETACADWGVVATVAMSATLYAAEYVNHACPRDLLLIHGGADRFTGERHQDLLFARATRGLVTDGHRSGDLAAGDARMLLVIPGAGHVSLLWDTSARQAAIDWLLAALGVAGPPRPVAPFPAVRLALGLLALIATIELWSTPPRSAAPASDRGAAGDGWVLGAGLLAVAGAVLLSASTTGVARMAWTALPPMRLDGAAVFVWTLVVAAAIASPLAVVSAATAIRRRRTDRRGRAWRAMPLLAAGRAAMAYLGLRVLMVGFYDPTPRLSHLPAAMIPAGVAFAALLVLAAARSALDACVPQRAPGMAIVAVRGGAVALLLGVGLWSLSARFNDLTAPAIELVPFALALVVLTIILVPGRRGERALDRALYGTIIAGLVLATVFPLSA